MIVIAISAIQVLKYSNDVPKQDIKVEGTSEQIEPLETIKIEPVKLIDKLDTLDLQSTTTIKMLVQETFGSTSVMVKVASCESRYKQFNKDGSVHRGVQNKQDVGVMQINEYWHLKASKKLGYDIHTVKGNILYGKYLYDREGTKPWNWSKPMWSKGECK